ncbi:hypothetical protein HMPREF1327_00741 [Enterococcus faecalis 599]|nr:hypothetical protein HMPREF1327_00741 [Enterococcus faecalis 599]
MGSARLSAVPTKTIKPLRPFFFLREKRNKKTCPLPPQQRGVLLSCSFKNQQGTGSIF